MPKMRTDISNQVSRLRTLSRHELLDLWRDVYGRVAPSAIRREVLVPFLAYKIQENAYGGLKPATRAELRRMARALERNPSSKPHIRPRIKPGTRLFRQWRGQMHEVFVTESGYEYRGVGYRSLSEIARKVTGARWSGPAFFRLKNVNSVPGGRDD
jgi:hypothetical protein